VSDSKLSTEAPRIFQGLVRSFVAAGQPVRDRYTYTLVFVPKLWFMRQTHDCRIFPGKTIAEIVSLICNEAGQTIQINVSGDQPVKPYTAQNSDIAIEASTGNITVRALNSIKLTVGGNSIEINAEGVTITAMKVSVQGQAMVQLQAPMTQISADGMLTMNGGVVMVN
jgi:phage baseplate assembly protein gpV